MLTDLDAATTTDPQASPRAERLSPTNRTAVAMWDFSWLVRQSGSESEYSDWDRVLEELVARGYDCVRIDPFPHLFSANEDQEFTILPQPQSFMWGNHTTVRVEVRRPLEQFLRAIKKQPLKIALSSWFLDDAEHKKQSVVLPEDYAKIWKPIVRTVAEAGMLDRIAWVDLCNEFPMSIWAPTPYQRIFGSKRSYSLMPSALLLERPWSKRAIREINQYFATSIGELRDEFPDLLYTFSFQEFGRSNLYKLDLTPLDLIETHIWASDDFWWSFISQHYKAAFGGLYRNGVSKHAAKANRIYERHRARCLRILDQRMEFWRELATARNLPLVTTEGWASTFYDDVAGEDAAATWAWLKDLTEAAVQLAIEKGWSGICSSNFCQPHFAGFWSDVSWHRKLTSLITGPVTASTESPQ